MSKIEKMPGSQGPVVREAGVLSGDLLDSEAKRVAACFGVRSYTKYNFETVCFYQGETGAQWICWGLDRHSGRVLLVELGDESEECFLSVEVDERKCVGPPTWKCEFGAKYRKEMAAGLYCLGFEDEEVLAQLNAPLTPREKEELRAALPRQFWPPGWHHAAHQMPESPPSLPRSSPRRQHSSTSS